MADTLVLWDVDGTLVACGDIGAAVFDRAIAHVVGRPPPHRITMSGKTDPQIVGEYLDIMGLGDAETVEEAIELLERPDERASPTATAPAGTRTADAPSDGRWPPNPLTSAILHRIVQELASTRDELTAGVVLPGVPEVLARLHDDRGVAQSVLTGNVTGNAATKLDAFGLLRWLDLGLGAFGSDHVDRRQLVPVAVARTAARLGRRVDAADVWLVGDTPYDLAAARAVGARCLLVATGRHTLPELTAMGPDAAVADLSDTDAVLSVLTSRDVGAPRVP